MCDVIKIRLKRRHAMRSGKGNQLLNIKTAVERPIFKLGLPNFRWSLHSSFLDAFLWRHTWHFSALQKIFMKYLLGYVEFRNTFHVSKESLFFNKEILIYRIIEGFLFLKNLFNIAKLSDIYKDALCFVQKKLIFRKKSDI